MPDAFLSLAPEADAELRLECTLAGWGAAAVKRAEDLLLAILALALFGLPMLLIALAVRLDSPGPVLFRQTRTGLHGAPFTMMKFRTMRHGPEAAGEIRQATRGDARITRIGAVLRRTSLDELPQLFNVLRGDMAMVGPRPHAPGTRAAGRLFQDVVPHYSARYRVRPGLTGLAQVRGFRARPTPRRSSSAGSTPTSNTSIAGPCGWTSRSCCAPRSRYSG